jgi:hypothetical protein
MPDLDSDQAREAAGRTLAAVEEDCSRTWPSCPRRGQLICDCRLRAVRVLNALKMLDVPAT